MYNISGKLRNLRGAKKMTRNEVAAAITSVGYNTSYRALTRWETAEY
jgi:transcriptional regulator with XRE-family HTH domain